MRRLATTLALAVGICSPAFAALRNVPVEWQVGDDRFRGMLVYDDANATPRPGLVMVPNWMGMSAANIERAATIAGDDYVVLVADVYGKGVLPEDKGEAKAQVMKAYADGGLTLRKRAAAAMAALQAQHGRAPLDPARIGAFGFCFGGSVVLELARSGADLAGVVSLHGDLDSYHPAQPGAIKAAVLALNGADDSSVPATQVAAFEKEMRATGADWQFVNFGGARHCFTQPEDTPADPADNCRYHAPSARRALAMLHAFFRERFARE
jgi:dienelactone hydrolase